ncbi:MAG: PilN domain-containing protein [Gemmatimonadota bacterium]|nr:PilN domain-containing protein [Gemmatimonadota bacterium]
MIRINLLPVREERRKQDLRQLAMTLAATLIGSVALAGLFHLSLRSDLADAQASLAATKQQIDRFGPQIKKVEEYKKTKAQIEKKLEVIQTLERARSGPVHVLDELALHAPEKLWVTRIQAQGRTIRIEGMSLDNELVAFFMTALNGSPYFRAVELEGTEAKTVNGFKLNAFELSAIVTSPEAQRQEQESQQATRTAAAPGGTGR